MVACGFKTASTVEVEVSIVVHIDPPHIPIAAYRRDIGIKFHSACREVFDAAVGIIAAASEFNVIAAGDIAGNRTAFDHETVSFQITVQSSS